MELTLRTMIRNVSANTLGNFLREMLQVGDQSYNVSEPLGLYDSEPCSPERLRAIRSGLWSTETENAIEDGDCVGAFYRLSDQIVVEYHRHLVPDRTIDYDPTTHEETDIHFLAVWQDGRSLRQLICTEEDEDVWREVVNLYPAPLPA